MVPPYVSATQPVGELVVKYEEQNREPDAYDAPHRGYVAAKKLATASHSQLCPRFACSSGVVPNCDERGDRGARKCQGRRMAAQGNGESRALVRASSVAPLSTSNLAASRWPSRAARWSGVSW